jgi:predicted Zn-dependent protease
VSIARRHLAAALLPCLLAAACSMNPATGKRQLSFFGEEAELAMGAEADEEIVATVGLYDDPDVAAYVEDLGRRLASTSERPYLPWKFKVLDDPTVNAFALPGGYVYVTRGILTHLSSEAELGGVLGHEIGHVTARHGVNQMSKALLVQAGLAVAVIADPDLEDWGLVASAGMGLLFLKYGRDDERQADDLGLRYMTRAGLDGRLLPEVFSVLQGVQTVEGAGRLPSWLASHPDPGARRQRIEEQLAAGATADGSVVGRDTYLARLDGMVFGEDPRDGYFEGREFRHPGLAFRLSFPAGWKTANQARAVSGVSPAEDAAIQVSLAAEATAAAAAERFFAADGIERGESWEARAHGLPASWTTFEVPGDGTTADDDLAGRVAFVAHRGQLFQLLGLAQTQGDADFDEMEAALATFEPLDDAAARAVGPKHLELVKLDAPMTLARFQELYPSTVPLPVLALINHAQPEETLEAGRLVKRVVGGTQ